MSPPSPTLLLAVTLLITPGGCSLVQLGPSFVVEPPGAVRFAAGAGTRVLCAARGDPPPIVTWLADDGTQLDDTPGLRRVHANGTLEIMPSSARRVAPTTLRCRAANVHGTVLSREVTLQPVYDSNWEAVLSAAPAAEGGVAALTCSSSTDPGLVAPAVWYKGDRVVNADPPTPDARYLVAGSALLIRDVARSDAGAYSCLARHALTALTKRSRPAHLAVTVDSGNSAPRLVATAREISVPAGAHFCVPCVASDRPTPHYTWYRETNGRLQPVEASSSTWLWAGGAALCVARASRAESGAWLCKAYNVYGDATAQARVDVNDALTVTVTPSVVVADTGSTVRFNCTVSDPTASVRWLHDGATVSATSGAELVVRGVARAHRGMYQCVARRGADTAHAVAELRLGESAPEMHYTFIEQALRAGGAVSLRCAAAGSPPPRIAWLLDAQPLDQFLTQHRYSISEETSLSGDVVSVLNVSSVSAADGGRYTCRASNSLGLASHSARLNIYGPPSIRALGPVRVVAGANATIYCPYAGYPISSISWWWRGAERAVGGEGRVSARGAALRLAPALPSDAGHYACAVTAPDGAAARRDLDIQVRNPPKISPFIFSSELTEGSSVQVLCGVSSGDKPMYFSWLKDGAPLPSNLQIEEKSLNEFSLLMFSDLTARHSGDYTCRVSNHAATVNYTATLSVKVAPSWVTEPLDAAVLLGAPLLLECAAKGYPTPTVSWYRRIGEAVSPLDGEQWELIGSAEWGGGVVRARNGSLSASAAARAHQGLYRCVADNGVGPPLLKHVNVTIHEPAHFDTMGGERNITSVRGRSAALSCHALGDAPLTVHWTHRGNRLDLNSYRWTVSEARTSAGVRSTLQLRAAERADSGEYRCHAHNQYGRSELLVYLHVEEPPEAPRSLRLGGVGSRWVRLLWRAVPAAGVYYTALYTALHSLPGADSKHNTLNLTLENSLREERVEADGYQTLSTRLEGLRPAAAYSLRVAAANHVGQSPHSDPLLFTTLEEAPSGAPQRVRVRAASSGELHASWAAPPRDSWNGELLGYVVTWRELGRFEGSADEDDSRRAGTMTSPGWSSSELTISGLRTFSRYAVSVRAYNRAGAGPSSPTIYATTADGVPESPPGSVRCEAVSARALRVRWTPPPDAHAHALRGYDLHYAPLHFSHSWSGAVGWERARAGPDGDATLPALRTATNYSVSVRARTDAGAGPPSPPVYCTTLEDVPGAAAAVRALPASADAVRVAWLPPALRAGALTHYTLYTRELGKMGGEWSQRVEVSSEEEDEEAEMWREVRGLREFTVYEFWVRAATAAGDGAPSRPAAAAPSVPVGARVSSFGRVVRAALGGRAKLRCAAVGALPLRRRWTPLPRAHTLTDTGDLIIHKVSEDSAGNYTCSVRNSAGADGVTHVLAVALPPAAPAPRLLRADPHTLLLAWESPVTPATPASPAVEPVLGYTIWWSRVESPEGDDGSAAAGPGRSVRVPASETQHALGGLACGTLYRVSMQAHNPIGTSPHSQPLLARTKGDKAKAAPGKEFVWANSTALRLNLLAWAVRCPVAAWRAALRPAAGGVWADLRADGEAAEATNLRPGTWYEIKVIAKSPAGDTTALYRAATHTHNGERIGEPIEVAMEARSTAAEGAGAGESGTTAWRGAAGPALAAAALAALLAAAGATAALRRRPRCLRRPCALPQLCQPHPQLYTTEPSKRNGKTVSPSDGDLHEISPYATFSMSEAGGGGVASGGCALHLRTFGRAEALDLAAPPARPNLLRHTPEYGRSRAGDSDSESSGSPCAACAAELYRLPASAHPSETLPALESSAEDASYSAGGRARRGPAPLRGRRRRDHARHASGPTVRYFSSASLLARQEAL